jgi:beta-glucosidase
VNGAGLDFYDKLVDGLLDAGIVPFATLYHWDLPQPLEDRGGWTHRGTPSAFADYARVVTERLGDCIEHWTSINETWCVADLGYRFGEHAPRTNRCHRCIGCGASCPARPRSSGLSRIQ